MSLEDLERAGITLPRAQWGKRRPDSAVNRPLFLAGGAGAIAAGILMYCGGGGITTWAGAIFFLLSFFAITLIALRAVTGQCQATPSEDATPNNQSKRKSQP